jgi:hypothetical protein
MRTSITALLLGSAALAAMSGAPRAENAALFEMSPEGLKKAAAQPVKRKTVKAEHAVRVRPEALEAGVFDVILPSGEKESFRREESGETSAGYRYWMGASLADPTGKVTLVEQDGRVNATLLVKGKVYSLEPSGSEGEHRLLERDFKEVAECTAK